MVLIARMELVLVGRVGDSTSVNSNEEVVVMAGRERGEEGCRCLGRGDLEGRGGGVSMWVH